MNTIILIGYMGSGKTTVANLLSEKLQYKLVDTDNLIEQQQGNTCDQIIKNKGEQYFRSLEHKCLINLQHSNLNHTIIATGGGMPCFNNNISLLNQLGTTIYLKWKPTDLLTRLLLTDLNKRPLLKDKTDNEILQYIQQTLPQREIFYNQAQIIINAPVNNKVSESNDNEIAKEIIKLFA